MTLSIRPAITADAALLRHLAEEIWRDYYPPIIGHEQVEYMLPRMYGEEVISKEIAQGTRWEIAWAGDDAIGFLTVAPPVGVGRSKHTRLYLKTACHGRGWGQLLLERACTLAAELGATTLYLQVNKENLRAIAAYERGGFIREREAVFDIGDGFVMDDYIYARAVAGTSNVPQGGTSNVEH
jgi:ribosomal protein S18 acetylase RimI-like enzyme